MNSAVRPVFSSSKIDDFRSFVSYNLAETSGADLVQARRSGFQMMQWSSTDIATSLMSTPLSSGLEPAYDQRRRNHCLFAAHGCRVSCQRFSSSGLRTPLLVSGTFWRAMLRPHNLYQFL